MNKFIIVMVVAILTACTSTPSRYSIAQDVAPTRTPTEKEIIDPIPTYQTASLGGNKPSYVVNDKRYQVLKSAKGFEQEGIASWYGRKFHGHLTSNGETYDMFSMSAAHKNLPIPTYLEVTNLDNNKKAIVRVNDRGPFHEGRIIDLSYSAAYKLGITQTGTGRVKIRSIATSPGGYSLVEQADNKQALNETAAALSILFQIPSQVIEHNGTFQLLAGPIKKEDKLIKLIGNLRAAGYPATRFIGTLPKLNLNPKSEAKVETVIIQPQKQPNQQVIEPQAESSKNVNAAQPSVSLPQNSPDELIQENK